MAWLVGIDEAGYGPNLGPFIMSAVACQLPDGHANADIWQLLGPAMPNQSPESLRRLVDDSKILHTTRGLAGLEAGVLMICGSAATLDAWLQPRCIVGHSELRAESWYRGNQSLPTAVDAAALAQLTAHFAEAGRATGVDGWRARCVVVNAGPFNTILDQAESKGAVLAESLVHLVRDLLDSLPGDDSIAIFVDKHGGRNTYAAIIQHAVRDCMVLADVEGMLRSSYRVEGMSRPLRLTFQPRADSEHFCVALASMASKYVRELCMVEFNQFWATHVPGLKPTAGYPNDATRYWQAIQPAALRLGLTEAQVWRRK